MQIPFPLMFYLGKIPNEMLSFIPRDCCWSCLCDVDREGLGCQAHVLGPADDCGVIVSPCGYSYDQY